MIFFFKLIFPVFIILFLPGYLLNLILFRDKGFDYLESVPYAFGSSLAINFIIGFLAFVLHLNIKIAFVLFVLVMLLLIAGVIILISKKKISVTQHLYFLSDGIEKVLAYPALFFLALTLILGVEIEMPLLGQEDKVPLMMAQKIKSLSSLQIDRLLFRPGDVSAYLVPLYSYLYAFLSYVSQLEVVQIYCRIRFVLSLISISAAYALARVFFPKLKELPWFVVLFACATIWSGFGTNPFSAAYSQFFPYPVYQDSSVCVLIPVYFLFFIKGVGNSWRYSVLSLLLTTSFFFIHIREAIVLLILYTSSFFGLVVYQRNKKTVLTGLFVILGIIIAGLFIQSFQSNLIDPNITKWNKDLAAATAEKISVLLETHSFNLLYPPLENDLLLASYNAFYIHPYYLLSVFLLPVLFCLSNHAGIKVIAFTLFGSFFISAIPIFSLLFIKHTYMQILYGGPAVFGMFPFSYIIFSFFVWCILRILNKYLQDFKNVFLAVICAMIFIFPVLFHFPQWFYKINPVMFYAWLFIGSLICFILSFLYPQKAGFLNETLLKKENYLLTPFFVVFLIFSIKHNLFFGVLIPDFEKKATSLSISPVKYADELKRYRNMTSSVKWEDWYNEHFKWLPWHVVEFVRNNTPDTAVFSVQKRCDDSPFLTYDMSLMTGRFVYTSGSFNSMVETDFFENLYKRRFNESPSEIMWNDNYRLAYLKEKENTPAVLKEHRNYQYYMAMVYLMDDVMCKYQPIYNTFDSPEATLMLIRAYNIDYVYVTPDWYSHLENVFSAFGNKFEKIYDKDSYAIYRLLNP